MSFNIQFLCNVKNTSMRNCAVLKRTVPTRVKSITKRISLKKGYFLFPAGQRGITRITNYVEFVIWFIMKKPNL